MKLRSMSIALCAALLMGGVAPASLAQVKTYSAKAFYETTTYRPAPDAGFAFSADGKTLLISSDQTGVYNVYALPAAGGPAVPLTTSTTNATFAISWFPKDGRVLFSADGGGNELSHVYVRGLDGAVKDLTPGDKVKAGFVGWSASGDHFWLYTNERDAKTFDLYAYDAKTYARTLVFQNSGYELGDIAPDGGTLALSKPRTSADGNLYLVNLRGKGEPRMITPHTGNVSYNVYGFTPDGKALVFATDEHGEFNQAWTYALADGVKAPLIKADWDVQFVSYSKSGRYRVSALNADASTQLTLLDQKTGQSVKLTGLPDGDIGAVRFNRDESAIALSVSSDTSPNDIFVADLKTGQARRLTKAQNPAIAESDLVEASVARFKSYDGLDVPGVLYRPKDASAAKPVPAIVLVHGGPGGQSRKGYNPMVQHLVNHGYAVYAINNRGSSGYGKTFFHLDDKKHGDVDLKDVVASKAWLQGMDWIADDGIAVVGGSYGGYMTAAALAFQPDVFDAGIDIFGVTNWVRTLTSIPPWWASFKESLYDEMGDPATDGERHRAISPLFHAKNIKKPLLVIQGANDPRVLKVESDELVAGVKAGGTPVEYVVFPDEGHGFLKRDNRITASDAYVDFLDKYLKK
jgi:dipeptidyl aminopeptidase/acylaminoacyl peptidase